MRGLEIIARCITPRAEIGDSGSAKYQGESERNDVQMSVIDAASCYIAVRCRSVLKDCRRHTKCLLNRTADDRSNVE